MNCLKWFRSKTYKRLTKIYRYCDEFFTKNFNQCSFDFIIDFNSALGKVSVTVRKFITVNYGIILIYKNNDKEIFKIHATSSTTNVEPLLNDDLSGHDIDLALLELEEYLANTYGDIDKIIKQKEKKKQEILKRHRREIKILEESV